MTDRGSFSPLLRKDGLPLALLGGLVVLLAVLAAILSGRPTPSREAGAAAPLTRPLRAKVTSNAAYDEVLRALRIYHYQPKPRAVSRFRDFFYDTNDWSLLRSGGSLRVRVHQDDLGATRGKIRFVTTNRSDAKVPFRLSADLSVGERALDETTPWQELMARIDETSAAQILEALEIAAVRPDDLAVRLSAEVARETLDVSDKGRDWFELHREVWGFERLDGHPDATVRKVGFDEIVIDTRLQRDDPELIRRVESMRRLVTMVHGIVPVEQRPHERAIEILAPET